MIDIHSHILPGLDDGSSSLEESVDMLQVAAESGTTAIVATPHANTEYHFDPAVVEAKIAELQEAAGDAVRIYYGCDFHLQYDNITDALQHPEKYTVNHKCYLMVEFSDMVIFQSTTEVFRKLMDAGMVPVITHPERNPLLRQRLDDLKEWVGSGMLLQVTADSYLGRWGKSAKAFADLLTREALVQVVASDAHDTRNRRPSLREVHEYLSQNFQPALADRLLQRNPAAIVNGKAVEYIDPALCAGRRPWYRFW